ncbi:uncharacterized protein EAF01_008174 [Botrytis porri]|uniref:uncharacterized protein n=1 Tax=Botrytis porri TaxID=87229 RepID=UPI0019018A4B|nr:uncharacterized protein EAF01_008174 [Botrytis porri]KAF7898961.1 hypothetical protein EAF01_008174 [Botrytis porri]
MQAGLEKGLRVALEGWEGSQKIIEQALSDIEYVRNLDGKLGELVKIVYVNCLSFTHAVSVCAAVVALIAACCVRQHRV